jgi:hypothetical protein
MYKNESILEKNSVAIALNLLARPAFGDLRSTIYRSDKEEQERFHQLLVNTILATDILDKILKQEQEERWTKAFNDKSSCCKKDNFDLKGTLVIERIIQASDVAHTMQHWHVFCRWNEKLFSEQYKSFCAGCIDKNPGEDWYMEQLTFFDDYVLPLANNLKECGGFGVSSDEYLMYALANRDEWSAKGEAISKQLMVTADATRKSLPRKT